MPFSYAITLRSFLEAKDWKHWQLFHEIYFYCFNQKLQMAIAHLFFDADAVELAGGPNLI